MSMNTYGAENVFFVGCFPKTELIAHYQKTLGAVMISKRRMAIYEDKAKLLLDKYFPETEDEL